METMILHGLYENGKITFEEKKLPKGKALVEIKLVPEKKVNYKKFQQLKGIWKNRTDIGTDSVQYVNQLRKKIEKREI
jgi:hypothetical protein